MPTATSTYCLDGSLQALPTARRRVHPGMGSITARLALHCSSAGCPVMIFCVYQHQTIPRAGGEGHRRQRRPVQFRKSCMHLWSSNNAQACECGSKGIVHIADDSTTTTSCDTVGCALQFGNRVMGSHVRRCCSEMHAMRLGVSSTRARLTQLADDDYA